MTESGSEETGLNLIHDTASAAGSFPHSVWGYDRQTVDTYVQEIEQQLSAAKQLIRHMQHEVANAKQLSESSDLTKLGHYTTQMLQAAEGQSRELLDHANQETERIKAEGRRLAAESRASGEQEADDIRLNAQATFKKMRAEVDLQCAREIDRARQQATSILDSARAQADHQLVEVRRAADATTEAAKIEAERIVQSATTQAAKLTADTHESREETLNKLAEEHQAAATRIASLLEESRVETEAASQRLQDEVAHAAEMRRKAEAESEDIKVTAVQEAEVQIAKAHTQASLLRARAEEQYGWRKEQLERETKRLQNRKQAIMAQLANLSALATHSLAEYPQSLISSLEDAALLEDPVGNEPTTAVPAMTIRPQILLPDGDQIIEDDEESPAGDEAIDGEKTVVINTSVDATKVMDAIEDDSVDSRSTASAETSGAQ